MKVFNLAWIVLFVLFAALQFNDPDPFIWVTIYLYGALMCYLALKKRYNVWLFIGGLIVYSVYAAFLFFDPVAGVLTWINNHNAEDIAASMEPSKPWIEETREFFGLMILITVLSINMYWLSRKRRTELTIIEQEAHSFTIVQQ